MNFDKFTLLMSSVSYIDIFMPVTKLASFQPLVHHIFHPSLISLFLLWLWCINVQGLVFPNKIVTLFISLRLFHTAYNLPSIFHHTDFPLVISILWLSPFKEFKIWFLCFWTLSFPFVHSSYPLLLGLYSLFKYQQMFILLCQNFILLKWFFNSLILVANKLNLFFDSLFSVY